MLRRLVPLTFVLALPAALGAQAPPVCAPGSPTIGDLGIEYLLCVGSTCSVRLRADRGYQLPARMRVEGQPQEDPSLDRLREGDILIAIDGMHIATREGGARLANLPPWRTVKLRIRRDGKEKDLTVLPRAGCNAPRRAVPAARPRR